MLNTFERITCTPGSPSAVSHGCTCDAAMNNHGKGTPERRGVLFYPHRMCPLHGRSRKLVGLFVANSCANEFSSSAVS
jgi:hypothetical protein